MTKSKTLIEKQTKRKSNSDLVETIHSAKKNKAWLSVAEIISYPRRKRINMNLDKIDKETKAGESIIIPGKVLSQGEISKKIKIVALGFSENAKEKLLKHGCEISTIKEEIKKNPNANGLKILK